MNRRELFASAAALALPIPVAAAAAEEKEPLKTFQRYNRELDRWEPVTGFDVKSGDVIWNTTDGMIVRVIRNEPEKREFCADYEIDPATNEWVSSGEMAKRQLENGCPPQTK